jgi:cupin 2 domain-containing protein
LAFDFKPGKQVTNLAAGNIFAGIRVTDSGENEDIKELLACPELKIERIVSHGHVSPPGIWFGQTRDEWVIVLAGSAKLRFEDEAEARLLNTGDYVFIPAKRRHRIDWTSETEPTVWLAVHFEVEAPIANVM